MNSLKTVATFTYPHEAHMLLGRLQAEGIFCFLENENIVTANPFYSTAVGGVQIRVKQEDEERALAIIEETTKAGNEFSSEMPTDEEIVALPRESVNDSRIMKWFGWIFGK